MIDDDRTYRGELAHYVRSNGFDSLEFDSFAATLELVQASGGAFVIVAELTAGSRHLFDYIAQIKRAPSVSVLVLSNRWEETEKIVALELGADDFIPKTTDRREILARIRAAARRLLIRQIVAPQSTSGAAPGTGGAAGSWQFLRARRELIDPEGRAVRLTAAEFSLLAAFVENTGRPLQSRSPDDGRPRPAPLRQRPRHRQPGCEIAPQAARFRAAGQHDQDCSPIRLRLYRLQHHGGGGGCGPRRRRSAAR